MRKIIVILVQIAATLATIAPWFYGMHHYMMVDPHIGAHYVGPALCQYGAAVAGVFTWWAVGYAFKK